MTQLLVSVKNLQEALLALRVGADVIDLKDPAVGALGALSPNEIKAIVQSLRKQNPHVCISATIGENFADVVTMQQAMMQTARLGVDIVKFPLNGHAHDLKQLFGISKALSITLIAKKNRLFGVIFADIACDLTMLESCAQAGLMGVMLDTQQKMQDLLCHVNHSTLLNFVNECKKLGLKSGFAGSLQVQYIEKLAGINPSYMGFRGGLCLNQQRIFNLDEKLIKTATKLLHKHDINAKISYENSISTLNT